VRGSEVRGATVSRGTAERAAGAAASVQQGSGPASGPVSQLRPTTHQPASCQISESNQLASKLYLLMLIVIHRNRCEK
jgi:hypothetical protein